MEVQVSALAGPEGQSQLTGPSNSNALWLGWFHNRQKMHFSYCLNIVLLTKCGLNFGVHTIIIF